MYADSLPSSTLRFLYLFDDFLKTQDNNINMNVYGFIFIAAANHGWKVQAKNKFKLKSKDLYRKLYS